MWIYPDWFFSRRPRTVHPFTVVHGHLPIQRYDLLPSAYRIVMLREPVENLISIYYYWQSLPPSVHGNGIYELVKHKRLSLLEVAEIPRMRFLMSQTYFGAYDMRRFDVIGTYANRLAFIHEVSNLIGVPLSARERKNVTPPSEERANVLADTKLLARLRFLLQDDVRFYERFADTGAIRRRNSRPFRALAHLRSAALVRRTIASEPRLLAGKASSES
jgi:hypothetical protein